MPLKGGYVRWFQGVLGPFSPSTNRKKHEESQKKNTVDLENRSRLLGDGCGPFPVTVANKGLKGFPTKNVIILVVTGILERGHTQGKTRLKIDPSSGASQFFEWHRRFMRGICCGAPTGWKLGTRNGFWSPRFVCLMNCVVVELLEVVIGEKIQIFWLKFVGRWFLVVIFWGVPGGKRMQKGWVQWWKWISIFVHHDD